MVLNLKLIENYRLWSINDMKALCNLSAFAEDMFIEQMVNDKGYVVEGRTAVDGDRQFTLNDDITINLNTDELANLLDITSVRLGEDWIKF